MKLHNQVGPGTRWNMSWKITLIQNWSCWAPTKKKNTGFSGGHLLYPGIFVDFVDLFFLNWHVTWFSLSSSFDFNAEKKNRYMICVTSKQKMSPAEFWGWFTSITCGENWSFQTWMDVCIVFFVSLFFFSQPCWIIGWFVYIYIYIYMHIHTYIHTYIRTWICICIYLCTYI